MRPLSNNTLVLPFRLSLAHGLSVCQKDPSTSILMTHKKDGSSHILFHTAFARVNNIFDQFYTDVGSSFGPNAAGNYSEQWYSAPGRNFEIGLQFQF